MALHKDAFLDQISMIVGKNYMLNDGQIITIGTLRIQCHAQAEFASISRIRSSQPQPEKPLFLAGPQIQLKQPVRRWSLEKRQATLFCLCLLLPVTSFSLLINPGFILSGGSSQQPIEHASPEAFPRHAHTDALADTRAKESIAAKHTDQTTSPSSQSIVIAGVTSDQQRQYQQHGVATLISPSHVGQPGEQKPYGLASPWQRARHYAATISAAAQRYALDPALLKAVIHAESGFDPFAVSKAGAQGLMQIMPATAERLALADPFHPGNNVLSGSKLLRRLLDRYQQDETLALAAYNAGENAVEEYQGVPPYAETQEYVHKVRNFKTQYRSDSNLSIGQNNVEQMVTGPIH